MAAAAELAILISAQGAKDAANDIEGVGKKAEGLGGKLGGLSKAVGVGALAGGAGILALGAAAVSSASDIAESQNKVNVVFGDSAGAINDLAATAASKLGQTKAEVLNAAGGIGNLLTAMGQSKEGAADMSIGMVKLAADLGSFNNASSEEVLEAMTAAMAGETDGMKKYGVAINENTLKQAAMAAGLGDNVQALSTAEKQGLAYKIMLEQTKAAQGDFANTSDGMANGMKIIQSSIGDAVGEIGAGLLPAVQKAAGAFATFLQSEKFAEFKDRVIEVFAAVGDKLASIDWAGVADLVAGAFEKVGQVIGFLAENPAVAMVVGTIGGLIALFAPFAALIGPLIPIVTGLFTAMGGGAAIMGVLGTAFSILTGPIGLIVAAVIGLKLAWDNNLFGIQEKTAAVVEAVKQWFSDMVAKVEEIVGAIAAKWEEFKTNLQTAMDAAGLIITTKWTEFWTTITTKLQEIKDAVVAKWQEVKDAISEALELIWNTLKLKWDAFLREISDKLDAILGKVTEAWDAVKEKIQAAMDAVWSTIQSMWAQIRENIETALGNIRDNVQNIMGRVREIFDEVMGIIKQVVSDVLGHVQGLWENYKKFVQGVVDAFKQLISGDFSGAFETMKRTVQDGIDAVIGFFSGMKDSIMNALGDYGGMLVQVGTDIIEGLKRGISQSWDTLSSWMRGLFGDLVELAKKILGIASPSKVMAKEVGEPLAQGIGEGFARAWDGDVLPEMKRLLMKLPVEMDGWVKGLKPSRGLWGSPATETMRLGAAEAGRPRFSMGGLPPGDNAGGGGSLTPGSGSPSFGAADLSRTRVKPMQSGKGGFVAASKSNFWKVWVAKNGVPEESSARKTAAMLGIPLPQWLEDIYAPIGADNIKPDSPKSGGLAATVDTVAAELAKLAIVIGNITRDIITGPLVPPPGGGAGIGPPTGGLIGSPPGVPNPIGPPGIGPIRPGPLTLESSTVTMPNMTANVTNDIHISAKLSLGSRELDVLADALVSKIETKLNLKPTRA